MAEGRLPTEEDGTRHPGGRPEQFSEGDPGAPGSPTAALFPRLPHAPVPRTGGPSMNRGPPCLERHASGFLPTMHLRTEIASFT